MKLQSILSNRAYSILLLFLCVFSTSTAQENQNYVSTTKSKSAFVLKKSNQTSTLIISPNDHIGVIRAFYDLQDDILKVTNHKPELKESITISNEKNVIIAGTLGKSELIDQLVDQKIINPKELEGKWEKFIIKTAKNPLPGIKSALVIVGSDKRGTIYGVYDLSEQLGVSPWYWWADVPVKKKDEVYIKPGTYTDGEPAVKYRGIFINDEAPAFRNWAFEKFGGQNHKLYETIFELLLRNKANYLWPAMWLPTIFNEDDPLNPKTADEYGIVMSTSHHEPLMRSHNEWYKFGGGEWNYETNKEKLQEFWRGGIERMGDYESVVTVGMRGDGDDVMSEETAVELLEEIIKDQREIIADVTGKPANQTPQVWAVYKEVQDYFDKGMRVDEDIIMLLCDDNWGNLRMLPKKEDLNHKAGYGIYYHFDYVGSPVSYRWLNTTQIERVWEQMNLAYMHGVKDLWLVNVGDIKPMELPISFFMDYAWNPDVIQAKDLPNYYNKWAHEQFGKLFNSEIAELLSLYTKYNARRTPEMLEPETYSIKNYREGERIVKEYNDLVKKSEDVYKQLPENYKSSYYQLVHSPILLSANINEMYVAAGLNKYYARRGAAAANFYADRVKELFYKDAELTKYYHEELENGKWNHMMSQTHMGYKSWAHPPLNSMPAVTYVQAQKTAELGYFLEYGKKPFWGWLDVEADFVFSETFLEFDPLNNQDYYIDIINRGQENLTYSLKAKEDWIKLSKNEGTTEFHEKVYVTIDWEKAPKEKAIGEITISGTGKEYVIKVPINGTITKGEGFIENNGVIAFEAVNYSKKHDSKDNKWTEIENLGRTNSSLIVEPVTADRQEINKNTPRVEYDFTVFKAGDLKVETFVAPTQDFKKKDGLKFAIAIDDEEPQIININEGEEMPDWKYAEWWTKSVGDHIKTRVSNHKVDKSGKHTLKVWMMDTGIVFQKFVIDSGGTKQSYLGAPQSKYIKP